MTAARKISSTYWLVCYQQVDYSLSFSENFSFFLRENAVTPVYMGIVPYPNSLMALLHQVINNAFVMALPHLCKLVVYFEYKIVLNLKDTSEVLYKEEIGKI